MKPHQNAARAVHCTLHINACRYMCRLHEHIMNTHSPQSHARNNKITTQKEIYWLWFSADETD